MDDYLSLMLCDGPSCVARGPELGAAAAALAEETAGRAAVRLEGRTCFGRCRVGPNVLVRLVPMGEAPGRYRSLPLAAPGAVLHGGVTPEGLRAIVAAALATRGSDVR